ncbi:hypothetical protein [Gordoniibacillus kamchatkensis]|nr:hypothetical protein [Paenibacillus sp. VKM B-2647]
MRWTVLLVLTVCGGDIEAIIKSNVLSDPEVVLGPQVRLFLDVLAQFLAENLQIAPPYLLIMFALDYYGWLHPRRKLQTAVLLALPAAATFLLTPLGSHYRLNFLWIALWAIPYFLFTCVLLLLAATHERDPLQRKDRWITFFIFAPPLVAGAIFGYGAKALLPNPERFEPIMFLVSIVAILTFIGNALRIGALGMKIVIETRRLDRTIRIMRRERRC